MLSAITTWARRIKQHVVAVYFAAQDPRCPWAVRLGAMVVVAYALSPIDLIPDFIPVLGYLDDVLIVALGLWLVMRWIPAPVLADAHARAARLPSKPRHRWAGVCIVAIWLVAGWWLLCQFWPGWLGAWG